MTVIGYHQIKSTLLKKQQVEIVHANTCIGTFLKTDDGFKVTAPEGFVAVDTIKGNAVKLIDRLAFSHANFTAAKAWSK